MLRTLAIFLFIGCLATPRVASAQHDRWYFYEGHWLDTSAPAKVASANPGTETITVDRAPPADFEEVHPKAPFRDALWAKGHWYWSGASWQWAGGHFEQKHKDFVWVNARWTRHSSNTWGFSPGHWKLG